MSREPEPERKPASEDRSEQPDRNPFSAAITEHHERVNLLRRRRYPAFHFGHFLVWLLACCVLHPINFFAIGQLFSPHLQLPNDLPSSVSFSLSLLYGLAFFVGYSALFMLFPTSANAVGWIFLLFAIALQLARPRRREEDLGRLFVWGLGWWIWISIGFFQFKNVMENAG